MSEGSGESGNQKDRFGHVWSEELDPLPLAVTTSSTFETPGLPHLRGESSSKTVAPSCQMDDTIRSY